MFQKKSAWRLKKGSTGVERTGKAKAATCECGKVHFLRFLDAFIQVFFANVISLFMLTVK